MSDKKLYDKGYNAGLNDLKKDENLWNKYSYAEGYEQRAIDRQTFSE